jgi:hypothetical protein
MHPYDYTVVAPGFETRLVAKTSHRTHYEVTVPAAHETNCEKTTTVFGDFFMPGNTERAPLTILVPGLGDESKIPCLMMARNLVKQGISAFILYPIFHSSRAPEMREGQSLPSTPGEWLEAFQVSVTDVRRVIDWSVSRDEVDEKRIGIVGASAGGIISAIAMSVDRRILAGVFITTGGNMEEMSWGRGKDTGRAMHSCSREECRDAYSKYPRYLDEVTQKGFQNAAPAKECFLFDPLTFAAYLRERPVLMINALQDEIVPKRSATDLWKACGRPPIVWLPGTHGSIFSPQHVISQEVTGFLQEKVVSLVF